jgi:transposase
LSQGKKQNNSLCMLMLSDDLYKHIPKNHFYEQLGKILNLDFIYELTRPLYSIKMGRPSLDPVVFFKCMIAMSFENIIYFTDLEFRLADSLVLRRFIGYELYERVPDESTIRKTFQKMPEETCNIIFDHILDICNANGLIKGNAITTDSTLIEANASMDSLVHKELGCSNRDFFMTVRRMNKLDNKQDDDSNQDDNNKQDDDKASQKPKKQNIPQNEIWESSTDPDAKIMSPRDKRTHLYHRADVAVDMDTGIILSAGAEAGDISDRTDFLPRIDEAVVSLNERGFDPMVCVADSGHLNGPNLAGLEERGLISVITDRSQNYKWAPGFGRDDFSYNADRDIMTCPEGHELTLRYKPSDYTVYSCKGSTCRACKNFGICTKNKNGRSVKINGYERQIKENAERANTDWGQALRWSRMQRGEAPFAYLKGFGGLRRISTRGLSGASKRVILASACWNLLLVIKVLMGCLPSKSYVFRIFRSIFAIFRRLLKVIWLDYPNIWYHSIQTQSLAV